MCVECWLIASSACIAEKPSKSLPEQGLIALCNQSIHPAIILAPMKKPVYEHPGTENPRFSIANAFKTYSILEVRNADLNFFHAGIFCTTSAKSRSPTDALLLPSKGDSIRGHSGWPLGN
ncbi:hypothetical protein EAE99_008542 [Botrytis elliptica]|nr:hypothetical protein EAE99_008542 [Botrytis elliptica]